MLQPSFKVKKMHIIVIFDIYSVTGIQSFKKNYTILFFEEEKLLLNSELPILHASKLW